MVDVEGRLPKTQVTMSIDELIDSCEKGEAMDGHSYGIRPLIIKGKVDSEVVKFFTFFPRGSVYRRTLETVPKSDCTIPISLSLSNFI